MTRDFIRELSEKIARAISDVRSFECRKSLHMKEEAQWRIYHTLVDCADFVKTMTPE